ncbi:MAG TPA: flagellar hook protein FlgE [Armatimonadota bacterium]|nr:flagellar hook protein FlgE [Armatimonadota bacterium]
MIQSMYNGVSGLRAHKTQMDVISNNIANINTIGFKSSRVSFREMLSQTIRGATAPTPNGMGGTNPMQIGLGSGIGSIDVSLTPGSLLPTGKSTDVAIEGSGFLVLGDGQGKYYTRDGSFQLDADGNLVSATTGMKVLGWMANPTTGEINVDEPITAASVIKLPVGQLAIARQTANISLGGNLNAKLAIGENATASLQVYDSLGNTHTVCVTFTKSAADDTGSTWTWEATSDDAAAGSIVGSGSLVFNNEGKCISGDTGALNLTLADPGGAAGTVSLTLDMKQVTQLAAESSDETSQGGSQAEKSTVMPIYQDGLPLGVLESFTVGKDGTISGMFDNGMIQRLGRLALAQFSNPSGLSRIGGNLLAETGNSGLPQIGQPATGSLGSLTSGFLESSNVDLPTEFANMIVAQRGFQANSRIITTSDEILQELVQLKR